MQNEKTIRLIGLWRAKETLWNMRSPLYKRLDIKDAAIKEIANEMQMTEDNLKKKFKSLRSVYIAEKKKVEASKASGASADDVYVPRLFWYNEMAFLDNCIIKRKTKDCMNEIEQCLEDQFDDYNKSNGPPTSKKAYVPPVEDGLDAAIKSLIELNNTKQNNEYQAFGDSVAQQLHNLPKKDALIAMRDIQAYLTEQQIKILEKPTILEVAMSASDIIEEVFDSA